jgi:hypothetical protein
MKQILLISFILLSCLATNAQSSPTDSLEYKAFEKAFSKKFSFPRLMGLSCKPGIISFALEFKEGSLNKILYSKNCTSDLKAAIEKCDTVFRNADWIKMFPSLKEKKHFSILIPIVYYFYYGCEKGTQESYFADLSKGLQIEGLPFEIVLLDPFTFTMSTPQP